MKTKARLFFPYLPNEKLSALQRGVCYALHFRIPKEQLRSFVLVRWKSETELYSLCAGGTS